MPKYNTGSYSRCLTTTNQFGKKILTWDDWVKISKQNHSMAKRINYRPEDIDRIDFTNGDIKAFRHYENIIN